MLERYREFLEEGIRADEAMLRSGLGYAANEVHDYLAARIQGRAARRPKLAWWKRRPKTGCRDLG